MMTVNEIRKGFYLDSVALMRLSREIADLPGVQEAALMMGTPSNMVILADAGLLRDGEIEAGGNDLVIAMKVEDEASGQAALKEALAGLDRPKAESGGGEAWRPRSIRAAVAAMPDANIALIAVPGDFAAAEARKALQRDLHVMMFSDNVSIEDELSLKQEARERGLLMMGPDCGTAIINGVPLAFANVVRRGNIGVIGASGTGTQEITALVSQAGGGISHAIGVGGRDLKKEIGGITTLMAIDALDEDDATERVVLVSKPPHPEVATRIMKRVAKSPKLYTVCFLGAEKMDLPANVTQVRFLKEAAESALGGQRIGVEFDPREVAARHSGGRAGAGRIEGLFTGGTLCAEAQLVLRAGGRKVVSNAAVPGIGALAEAAAGEDRVIDLGADEYTRGRPHPMIDPSVRDEMIRQALKDPDVGVVLLDVVIGYGAHADPAAQLAEVVAGRNTNAPPIVCSVTGTEQDPQGRSRQEEILENAGLVVAPSNAQACELALALAVSHE